jgi:hypothetical protein
VLDLALLGPTRKLAPTEVLKNCPQGHKCEKLKSKKACHSKYTQRASKFSEKKTFKSLMVKVQTQQIWIQSYDPELQRQRCKILTHKEWRSAF